MRNNCYFISRAETSATTEGMRREGGGERLREQPIVGFFVLSYKAAFRKGGGGGVGGVREKEKRGRHRSQVL